MINDILQKIVVWVDTLYTNLAISEKISNLLSYLSEYQTYIDDFKYYVSGIYFIFGKALITYMVSVAVALFALRLALALIKVFRK